MNPEFLSRPIAVLGCTGSVGRQALDVARHYDIPVAALAAGHDTRAAEETARLFGNTCRIFAMADEKVADELKIALADTDIKVVGGVEGVREAASYPSVHTVVNSVSGIAGLAPTLAAIEAGKELALANKESLVAAGDIVITAAKRAGKTIIPVDSEHSAIFQCLAGGNKPEKLIITCSGGPFYGMTKDRLESVSLDEALNHPTWSMGAKITVDSATLMNKGFEVIEAAHLFGMTSDEITVTVHRESIVHSMVQFTDGSVLAQMSKPDMRLCVMYALSQPHRFADDGLIKRLDFSQPMNLSFAPPDTEAFPLLPAAYEALRRKGTAGAALNGANERAVELFLKRRISFGNITRAVIYAAEKTPDVPSPSLDDIYEADREARARVGEFLGM